MTESNDGVAQNGPLAPKYVLIIIKSTEGEVFVHQRQSDKAGFPNMYGIGAGGHFEENETRPEAATRELREETGLETPAQYLFDFHYQDDTRSHVLAVFETLTPPRHIANNHVEWQWSGWIKPSELDQLRAAGKLCPDTALIYDKYKSTQIKS